MKTWHVENAVVATILLVVWWATGHQPIELVGSGAVFAGFCCASMSDRMVEKEAQREKPSVSCFKLFWIFFVGKEVLWSIYFTDKQNWSALTGVGIFAIYPFWRKAWRRFHPMSPAA